MGLKELVFTLPAKSISEGGSRIKEKGNKKYEILPMSENIANILKEKLPELRDYQLYVKRGR